MASVIDPRNLLISIAGQSLEVVEHNLNQETVPQKANAKVELQWKDQRVMIQYGATIYKIAIDAYGANTDPRHGPDQRVQPSN